MARCTRAVRLAPDLAGEMSTLVERRLFGSGDRVATWVWMAGMAWLILAIFSAVIAMGFILTIYLFPIGLAVVVVGVSPAIWFVGQLWVWRSTFWASFAAAAGLATGIGLFINGGGWSIYVWAVLIPAVFSMVAVWEMLRGPERRSPDLV